MRDMQVEALTKELEVRKKELDDALGAQSELQVREAPRLAGGLGMARDSGTADAPAPGSQAD